MLRHSLLLLLLATTPVLAQSASAAASRRTPMALGEKPLGSGADTGAKTKAEVTEALRASSELCARAYGQSHQTAALPRFEGDRNSRLYALLTNAMHNGEHYGNIVTYLRLNHMGPPSSRPTPPRP